jgi:hypothetical protein
MMSETYLAIRACRYNKKRFRVGDPLPAGWEPNHHFKPEAEANRRIKRQTYINMGFDPNRERAARAAQQARSNTIKRTIDMDEAERLMKEPEKPDKTKGGIDFLSLDSGTELTKEKLGNALFKQFGLKLNWKVINKADLVAAGQESAKRAQ